MARQISEAPISEAPISGARSFCPLVGSWSSRMIYEYYVYMYIYIYRERERESYIRVSIYAPAYLWRTPCLADNALLPRLPFFGGLLAEESPDDDVITHITGFIYLYIHKMCVYIYIYIYIC